MNRKSILDIAVFISCITGMILSYCYLDDLSKRWISLFVMGITGIVFFILAIWDARKARRSVARERNGISILLFLGEEKNVTAVWDIYGKTSIVFGRDEGENQVDVNLRNTDYAGTIDREHAVMNYSNGSWYIEDLDSVNGTRIQRGGEGNQYRVFSREPCKVEKNDIIYLGLAPIRIR